MSADNDSEQLTKTTRCGFVAWTPTQKRVLLIELSTGCSYSKIADRCTKIFSLERPLTRSGIAGKCRRLGLAKEAAHSETSVRSTSSPISASLELPEVTLLPTPEPIPLDSTASYKELDFTMIISELDPINHPEPCGDTEYRPATVMTLSPEIRCIAAPPMFRGRRRDGSGCRWPVGDPGRPGFRYCDEVIPTLADSYCLGHRGRAFSRHRDYR